MVVQRNVGSAYDVDTVEGHHFLVQGRMEYLTVSVVCSPRNMNMTKTWTVCLQFNRIREFLSPHF